MAWWLYAFLAALIWGFHYNLLAKSMTVLSPLTAYWMPTIIMVLGLPLFYKQIVSDFQAVMTAPWDVKVAVSVIMFTSFAASFCLYKAIQLHNPVHAGLIEITYPIFITIFAFLFFHENHFDLPTVIGGLLILSGAGLIVYNNS